MGVSPINRPLTGSEAFTQNARKGSDDQCGRLLHAMGHGTEGREFDEGVTGWALFQWWLTH